MVRHEEAKRLLEAAKHLEREAAAYARISAKAQMAPLNKTQKYSTDLAFQANAVAKAEAALHAVAVDAGVADLRETAHYAERHFRFGLGHDQRWLPAQPQRLTAGVKDSLTAHEAA